MEKLVERIDSLLSGERILWGAADLEGTPYADTYKTAIIIAEGYGRSVLDPNDEEDYYELMHGLRGSMKERIERLAEALEKEGIACWAPPVAQKDELSLIAPYSFKHGAVQAGLGWIGRNSLLVTKKFGPRVRLGALFIAPALKTGEPTTVSSCGKCRACAEACPWGFIYGEEWKPYTRREKLLDYHACNAYRSEMLATHGRKSECGLCLLACPWGKRRSALS
ncbi:4Fe-4S double cluster binding domain-containing protein [Gorillibacterium sp. CAU 1737]|uniref:4Fe-4S double cluster binding domain-containing protein n=1 Tax=Gorillibacterium sp. CAU 1737 TaxID=3140362 RepID=UPI003260CA1C